MVAIGLVQVAISLEKFLPVGRQLSLDEIKHAELHRFHTSSVAHGTSHEKVGDVTRSLPSEGQVLLIYGLSLLAITIRIVILPTIKGMHDNFFCIGVPIVKVQLDTKVFR